MELEEAIKDYKPNLVALAKVKDSSIVLLVGITGAGKDTIKSSLLTKSEYYNFISYTTRKPRLNKGVMEQDGQDYNFISVDEALIMLRDGKFIEAKEYAGNVYGTAYDTLLNAGDKVAVNDIEVQGVSDYKKYLPQVIAIFIVPPSFDEWQRRLKKRYSAEEFAAVWDGRRQAAIRELDYALKVPYYHFVINDDINLAIDAVHKIIANDDNFTRKDDEARLVARDLLASILSN